MSVRDHLISSLVAEVLGPREGYDELLASDRDPRDEYITGVLAPLREKPSPDPDSEGELSSDASAGEEDSDDGVVVAPLAEVTPVAGSLDPRSQPSSFGISFVVKAERGHPRIGVCATWARYKDTGAGYQRGPFSDVKRGLLLDREHDWAGGPDVRIVIRLRPRPDGETHVSVFLVNQSRVPADERGQVRDYVFQPQIRVVCEDGTRLLPVRYGVAVSQPDPPRQPSEDEQFALLYRSSPPVARGHFCSALWRQIDPERPAEGVASHHRPPFFWVDSVTVAERDRSVFALPDIRSEFVPCLPVFAPSWEWEEEYGPPPNLLARDLAQLWDPAQLRDVLMPLVDAYRRWIKRNRNEARTLGGGLGWVAEANLATCDTMALRIERGIDLLVRDPQIRLAFCFCNEVMRLQNQWRSRQGGGAAELSWRPFQLAFILLNLKSVADPRDAEREICDVLWVPTGAGKTEAYLALAAFAMALRRLRARPGPAGLPDGGGTAVVSRYTLRLLAVQQFRRTLRMVQACEYLRVSRHRTGRFGWRPDVCETDDDHLWGTVRFATGLWVGGDVTPNRLVSYDAPDSRGGMVRFCGALEILRGARNGYAGSDADLIRKLRGKRVEAKGEPAQVLKCPCCDAWLAVPSDGLPPGFNTIHLVVDSPRPPQVPAAASCSTAHVNVVRVHVNTHSTRTYHTVTFELNCPHKAGPDQLDEWWDTAARAALGRGVRLASTRASRPGYFQRSYDERGSSYGCDFEIHCPDPACDLRRALWRERVPLPMSATTSQGAPEREWQDALPPFAVPDDKRKSRSIPIVACTVDDQVYHRCPSMVIATADKFARLAFDPAASGIFGMVDHYHSRWGYYREGAPPPTWSGYGDRRRDHPPGSGVRPLHMRVEPMPPVELVIQDELHLIEGPLGTMVGIYESVVEHLAAGRGRADALSAPPKYIASSATVKAVAPQVQCVFLRKTLVFPPQGITISNSFFARVRADGHPLESRAPGRLYVGIAAPGKGALTPVVRIWSRLMQAAQDLVASGVPVAAVDPYWTLVGYFNAIRELAGARALYGQDIPDRLGAITAGAARRRIDEPEELSSRTESQRLPGLLENLNLALPGDAVDALLSTSMFGTGVDIPRLGLMVVHGQPKTSSAYIQATGRVGRMAGALVPVFYRTSRPRDLDHYEFFAGYHQALQRFVEPITVSPFSPRARERALGPLCVCVLRQSCAIQRSPIGPYWKIQQRITNGYDCGAHQMAPRRHDPAVNAIADLLEARSQAMPAVRAPQPGEVRRETASELDRWAQLAALHPGPGDLLYYEPTLLRQPQYPVVLGDPQHQAAGHDVAFRNAPQSLREVEAQLRVGRM